jgi:hypothetical protein
MQACAGTKEGGSAAGLAVSQGYACRHVQVRRRAACVADQPVQLQTRGRFAGALQDHGGGSAAGLAVSQGYACRHVLGSW